jgi:hypothetical protein
VWDRKRQVIWIVGGVLMGTWVAYFNSIGDDGNFVLSFFVFMEGLILLIMAGLFYFYSRH